jgi:predicted RNA-binding Zn ribbon-like protein
VPADGIAWLNRSLRACERYRQLAATKHGLAWSWTPGLTLADRVSCAVVRDAVDLLTRRDAVVLSQCVGEDCGWLFLDQSPSGRRKWCSMADCGNRAKARRHYRRVQVAAQG